MPPISAADCVAPAWRRTREVLFAPRSFGLFLKIAAVATLAELSNGFSFNLGIRNGFNGHTAGHLPQLITAAVVTSIVAVVLVALLIGLVIFYCGSRMQLVMVPVVGVFEREIAPAWRRFSSVTWRWIGLKLLLFLGFVAAMAVLMAPMVLFSVFSAKGHPDPFHSSGGAVAAGIVGFVFLALVFLVLIVLLIALLLLLTDFVPVFIAVENTSIRESLRYLGMIWRYEKGQILLYLLLRFVLGLAAGIGIAIVFLAAILIAAIPLGGGGAALYFALRHGGAGAHVVLIAAAVLGGLILAAWMLCIYIGCAGTMGTFFRAYALYFLGGRFPAVGAFLNSAAPQPDPWTVPAVPSQGASPEFGTAPPQSFGHSSME